MNRAEAFVFQNRISDALADLQVLIDNRYSGGSTTITIDILRFFYGVANSPFVSDRSVLIEYILLERRKEFIIQGLRWFDLKRYELPVDHLLEDNATVITLDDDDLRKVLQIPASAVDVGGLQPNPR